MSYCVNCGVELEESLTKCPLCGTIVINPNKKKTGELISPYPTEKGEVEKNKRIDLIILVTVTLGITALSFLLLNILVFPPFSWSGAIVGACIMIWVFLIPVMFHTATLSVQFYIVIDYLMIALYLLSLSHILDKPFSWFKGIPLQVTLLCFVISEVIAIIAGKIRNSFLVISLYVFIGASFLCLGLECIIDYNLNGVIELTWSPIVLTILGIISTILIVILSVRRLRETVRRKLHF